MKFAEMTMTKDFLAQFANKKFDNYIFFFVTKTVDRIA